MKKTIHILFIIFFMSTSINASTNQLSLNSVKEQYSVNELIHALFHYKSNQTKRSQNKTLKLLNKVMKNIKTVDEIDIDHLSKFTFLQKKYNDSLYIHIVRIYFLFQKIENKIALNENENEIMEQSLINLYLLINPNNEEESELRISDVLLRLNDVLKENNSVNYYGPTHYNRSVGFLMRKYSNYSNKIVKNENSNSHIDTKLLIIEEEDKILWRQALSNLYKKEFSKAHGENFFENKLADIKDIDEITYKKYNKESRFLKIYFAFNGFEEGVKIDINRKSEIEHAILYITGNEKKIITLKLKNLGSNNKEDNNGFILLAMYNKIFENRKMDIKSILVDKKTNDSNNLVLSSFNSMKEKKSRVQTLENEKSNKDTGGCKECENYKEKTEQLTVEVGSYKDAIQGYGQEKQDLLKQILHEQEQLTINNTEHAEAIERYEQRLQLLKIDNQKDLATVQSLKDENKLIRDDFLKYKNKVSKKSSGNLVGYFLFLTVGAGAGILLAKIFFKNKRRHKQPLKNSNNLEIFYI